jgi:hypothetical protein
MPELPVKEVRLPELHLPEISREEILRTVSEVRRPELELPRIEPRKLEIPAFEMPRLGSWHMPQIDIPAVDLANLIASAIAAIGIVRPRRRPRWIRYRWALLAGLGAGVAAGAVLFWRRQVARQQMQSAAQGADDRVEAMTGAPDGLEVEADDAAATTRVAIEGTTELAETDVVAQSNGADSGEMAASGDLAALGEESGSAELEDSPGTPDATEMTDLVSEPAPENESMGEPPADSFEGSSRGSGG